MKAKEGAYYTYIFSFTSTYCSVLVTSISEGVMPQHI